MKSKDTKRLKLFAARLSQLRKAKGLSQRALAANCDVDHKKISLIEGVKANLSLTTLIELAEGLGVHPADLLEGDYTN